MVMDDFMILSAYWVRYPPAHALLRAALGIGKREPAKDLGELLRRAGIDPKRGGRSSRTAF
jgi:hypothetical protein